MPTPNFRLEIHKSMSGYSWANDYLLLTSDMAEAAQVAAALVTFERNVHRVAVNFDWYRISTTLKGDRTFRHVGIGQPGLYPAPTGQLLPLFVTWRLDMPTMDSDPCRKYFRAFLSEDYVNFNTVEPGAVTALQNAVNTYLVNSIALDNIMSAKGHVVTGAVVSNVVQERQLHRRRKKKATLVVV